MQMTAKHWWPQRLLKHLKLCEQTETILLWLFLQLGFEHVLIICLGSHGLDAMMLALVFPCKASVVVGHKWFSLLFAKCCLPCCSTWVNLALEIGLGTLAAAIPSALAAS